MQPTEDLGTTVTLKPTRIMPTRIQATWQHRGEGWRVCARPKAGDGDVAETSLVGRPCFNRFLEKLGKSGCPLSPFPSPSSITWGLGFINSCYKNNLLGQAQGVYKVLKHSSGCFTPERGSMHICQECWGKSSFLTGDEVMRPTPVLTLVNSALLSLLPQEGSVVVLL